MTDAPTLKPCPFCGMLLEHKPPVVYVHPIGKCILSGRNFPAGYIGQWNKRSEPDPDYCHDDELECTMPWSMWPDLVDNLDLTRPKPIHTLYKGPTKWVVSIPVDTDGDGEADDYEVKIFDSESAALAALEGAG